MFIVVTLSEVLVIKSGHWFFAGKQKMWCHTRIILGPVLIVLE
jgi:hypothetical protein